MMRSLYSGVAGLRTHQTKMDVIGNNIANVNTVAFKATQTTFSDVMYQNMSNASAPTDTLGGVNAKQIGLGALTAATKTTIESTGASQDTGEAFDIRLSDGQATNFFIVDDGTGQKLFTRAGSFFIDGAGSLAMTSTGYIVQGWQTATDPDSGETYISALTRRLTRPAIPKLPRRVIFQVSLTRMIQPSTQTAAITCPLDFMTTRAISIQQSLRLKALILRARPIPSS